MADLTAMMQAAAGAGGGEPTDPFFENTVLLLHGDGTSGAQNNTFLDSSTNNFTITRNGNTTQGTFTPFSKVDGRFGNFFDGTNDNLSVAANAAFLYTGDFTVEMWVYPTRFVDFEFLFGTGGSGTQDQANIHANGTCIYFDGTNSVTSPTLQLNAWNHIAVTRSGTTIRAYANGVSGVSQTKSGNLGSSVNAFRIGERSDGVQDFNGYISNLRVVNGTAVYTGATYTVPTAPLTAITNTSLLTCQSNRFKDNSTNNFAITPNGDVKVTPFSPFPTLTAYDAATNGGSGFFDGSGDALTLPSNSAFVPGTGEFIIEFFSYVPSGNDQVFYDFRSAPSGNTAFNIGRNNDNGFYVFNNSAGVIVSSGAGTATFNTWNYIVVSRVSTTLRLFVNGSQAASATVSTDFSNTQAPRIGMAAFSTDNPLTGFISNFRFVKGSGVTSVTVPTAPLTAITNTSLLCNFTNAGIFDNSMFNDLETVGNAQIDTSEKKYGTGSIEFDGTGDALFIPPEQKENLRFGTGNFTIEFWAWKSANGSDGFDAVISIGSTGNYNGGFAVELSSSRGFCFIFDASVRISSNFNPNDSTWHHYAVVRNGSTFALYKDGAQLTTATLTPTLGITGNAFIGAGVSSTQTNFNGYIDDLRITKGIARYTAAFTPPTEAFPNIGD